MSYDRRIDDLCRNTKNPVVLNALHACREGHPLGHGNPWKWRNALFLCQQNTIDFLSAHLEWLERKASEEAHSGIAKTALH